MVIFTHISLSSAPGSHLLHADPPLCTVTSCSEKQAVNNPDRLNFDWKFYFQTSSTETKTAARRSLAIMAEFVCKHKTSLVQDSSTGRMCRWTVCISGLTLFSQSHNDFYRFYKTDLGVTGCFYDDMI